MHTFSEDYKIASEIAAAYGFTLNRELGFSDAEPFALETDIFRWEEMALLGTRREPGYRYLRWKRPIYRFTGYFGESLRPYYGPEPTAKIDSLAYGCYEVF